MGFLGFYRDPKNLKNPKSPKNLNSSTLILPDFLKISKGIKKRRSSGKPIFFTAPETARLSLAFDDDFKAIMKFSWRAS